MRYLLLAIFSFSLFNVFAQNEIIEATTKLIVQKKYTTANHYLDSILAKQKKNVDALMMKGNLILNASVDTAKEYLPLTESNESIFTTEVSDVRKQYDNRTKRQVAELWLKCLKIDSTRLDIRKGLCALYSIYGDLPSLKLEMETLRRLEAEDEGQVFRMAEYARKVKAEVGFEEGMSVYSEIARMYPQSAGIRCDIASEYFYAGNFKACFDWLDSCSRFQRIDETSFLNGAFIYSQLGYFEDAQHWLIRYDSTYQRSMSAFYKGLMSYSEYGDIASLQKFVATTDSNLYYEEYKLANEIIRDGEGLDLNEFKQLVNGNFSEWYKPLLYARALKTLQEECEPSVLYGFYHCKNKNYAAAMQFLEEGKRCAMDKATTDFWQLAFGYSLFNNGGEELLSNYLKPLLTSENVFYRQAATYFLALSDKNPKAQMETLLNLSKEIKQTKYVFLANQKYKDLRALTLSK